MNSVEWRRSKVQELASQGYNQSEISKMLQISQPTINRDISYPGQQPKDNIKRYIDERHGLYMTIHSGWLWFRSRRRR
jgi:predicted transcriptional regulator